MKWKRRIASALALCISLVTLAGCSRQAGNGPTDNQSLETSGAVDQPEAKGRFVEKEIKLPDEIKDLSLVSALRGRTGNLEFLLCDPEKTPIEYYFYSYDGTNWERDISGWMNNLSEKSGVSVTNLIFGQDGNYYMGGYDRDYLYHFFKVLEGGELQELLPELFQVPEGKEYGLSADMIAVAENGNILISTLNNAYYYTPEGELIFTMPQDFIGVEIRFASFLNQEKYYTVLDSNIVSYDLKNGAKSEIVAKVDGDLYDTLLFAGKDQDIYQVSKNGLSHMNKDSTVWELIIDGSLNSLSMQNQYTRFFFQGENNDFYGIQTVSGQGETILYHYTYDPDMVSVPPNVINIYALKDSPSVRQAVSMFQKQNPDTKVEFRVAMEDQYATMTEDIIRSLNTELLNGKGADVLILDGLPAESYKEKGILMDMSSLFKELEQQTPLLPNIVNHFKEKDGRVYYMPVRIRMPVAFGDPAGVKALESLDGIKEYSGERPLFAIDIYENLLRMVANLNYTEIFSENGKTVERESLIKYLSAVKAAGEKCNAKTEFSEEDMQVYWVNNMVMPSGFLRTNETSYDRKDSAVGILHLSSLYDTLLPWAAMDKENLHPSSINQIYYPSVLASINEASNHKEQAAEFIKTLYSNEIQEVEYDLNDGFPINQSALDTWTEMHKETSVSISFSNSDYELSGDWPTKEKITEVINIIPTLTTPVNVDQVLMGMIVDGSKEFFNGKATVEEAATEIESKLRIYLAE